MNKSPKKKGLIILLIGLALIVLGFITPSPLFGPMIVLIGIILLVAGIVILIRKKKKRK